MGVIDKIHMLKKILSEAERITAWQADIYTALHNIDAGWIVSGTIAWARLVANFPRTIAELLSDHNKAVHDALNIDADTVDGDHKADLETTMDSKINTHKSDADAHHPRQHDHSLAADGSPIAVAGVPDLPASKITSGRFVMARIPDGTNKYFLQAKGAGANPAYVEIPEDPAAGIPGLRTLGTGAQQAAAGNHTHTLSSSQGRNRTWGTSLESRDVYEESTNIGAGAEQEVHFYSLSVPKAGRAIAMCAMTARASAMNTLKLRLYIDGVQVAEDSYSGTIYMQDSVIGARAVSSGTRTAAAKYKNYDSVSRTIYICAYATGMGVAYI